MNTTRKLAKFVAETKYNDLTENVLEHIKLCILDWLGVTIAGSVDPASKTVVQLINELGGKGESTVIGYPTKTTCINAALINGITGHTVELDDLHEESVVHPAAPVIPAALALSEHIEAKGRDMITSIVLGYEIEIRIGIAIMPTHYKYWHPTGTCGTFGATAAAGKLLNLDLDRMSHAFGIAGTMASGLIESFGTMCKPFNAGRAARDGVTAALLAKRGFTGSTSILESAKGYPHATSRLPKLNKIIEGLGEIYETTNTIFKRHACCGHAHGAIDAVLDLIAENNIKPQDITGITVGTYPIAVEVVGNNYHPDTSAEAKFSLPYCVAVAATLGSVGLDAFTEEHQEDKQLRDLMKRVKVYVDPEYADVRLGCAKVNIFTKAGELTKRVDVPKGYPENPLTTSEIENKFRSLSKLLLTVEQVEDLFKKINVLEKIENIRNLTAPLIEQKRVHESSNIK
jgi:2-methylcitrate dehydratase PrpD